eukprot:CAMPEP_0206420730 /NCGR_PEP_ID=MMETSP0324_2-20121206/1030_1 /ASSEMBLY_ACC=CAM_ASM_000836 /TAXON_ID=2866 /ORGANISM="Crypthecodinium cohnii, Strain Seligo" /LENGTH=260 /DNA_ID=CAMNT_0053884697 /DNA_START=107 /DNA_END=886 /DNA_ORIENTATION=-
MRKDHQCLFSNFLGLKQLGSDLECASHILAEKQNVAVEAGVERCSSLASKLEGEDVPIAGVQLVAFGGVVVSTSGFQTGIERKQIASVKSLPQIVGAFQACQLRQPVLAGLGKLLGGPGGAWPRTRPRHLATSFKIFGFKTLLFACAAPSLTRPALEACGFVGKCFRFIATAFPPFLFVSLAASLRRLLAADAEVPLATFHRGFCFFESPLRSILLFPLAEAAPLAFCIVVDALARKLCMNRKWKMMPALGTEIGPVIGP